MSKEKALTAIIRHLELCNEKPENWYIGIADNVEQFLKSHNVDKIHDLWISREMVSAEGANEIKNELIEKYHMKCESEGEQGLHVLSYKRKSTVNK